jgi:hypothetical protein
MDGAVATEGISVDGRDTLVRGLDLPPGYYAERSEGETYLVDPEGRRVMRLPSSLPARDLGEEPTQEGWRELCRVLLVGLSEQTAECERLRVRAEAAEAERDQANAIAEDLYDFFRRRVREVVDRGTESEKRTHIERTERRSPEESGGSRDAATTSWKLNASQDGLDRGGGM